MPARKPPETPSEFLDRLTELMTNLPDRNTEEIEEDLYESGIDPKEAVQRVQNLVKTKLAEYQLEWSKRVQQERLTALEQVGKIQSLNLPDTLEGLKEKVIEILSGQFGQKAQSHAQAHFRKLAHVTENDLKSLFNDLERLRLLTHISDKDRGPNE